MVTDGQYRIWYWIGIVTALIGGLLVLLGIGDIMDLIGFDTNPFLIGLVLVMTGIGAMQWARDRSSKSKP